MKRRVMIILLSVHMVINPWAASADTTSIPDPEYTVEGYIAGNELTLSAIMSGHAIPDGQTTFEWSADSVEHVLVGGGRARVFWSVRDKEECMNTIGADPYGFCTFPPTNVGEDEPEGEGRDVDPYDLAILAVRHAAVHSAGLVVTPNRGWVYMNIPTLAHAQHPVVNTHVDLFGMSVPVRFEAQEFLFDFHSGEQPIRTTSPGAPYPDMSIHSTYVDQYDERFVTLTTTWSAFVTHPITGQVIHVPGALRTEEDSAPFRVVRSRHRLITPEEYGKP